jgi:hypothetical protein
MAGTHEDAMLMVELAKWGAMIELNKATSVLFSDEFEPDTADARDEAVQTVLGFTETLATLVKNDLLNRDLVYDWLWIRGMWDRVGPAALRAREKAGVPQLYENFEALAQGQGG